MRSITPCDCDGSCSTCRRRASYRRSNAKRSSPIGKQCSACGKVRAAEDGNHAGYCTECLRWWTVKREYGLSRAQYEAMLSAQGNGCAICGRPPADSYPGKLHIDHCHKTGRVRGLLCQVCNLSIGKFDHDPARLRKAADYLEEHTYAHRRD